MVTEDILGSCLFSNKKHDECNSQFQHLFVNNFNNISVNKFGKKENN